MSRAAIQHYYQEAGVVRFQDKRQNTHSAKCHPRDIILVDAESQDSKESRALREAICIDIRIGQGYPEVGVAKGLLWS